MEAIINLLKEQNPQLAQMMEMMQQNNQEEKTIDIEVEEIPQEINQEIEKLKKINQKLFSLVNHLRHKLTLEMQLNDSLALAIGACPDCFGTDNHCMSCRGMGKQGFFMPEIQNFNKYVLPAIKKFNLKSNQY